jgi:hypothetical protein
VAVTYRPDLSRHRGLQARLQRFREAYRLLTTLSNAGNNE